MAEFQPDLDDGELWLPADIVRDVGARGFHHCQPPSTAALRPRLAFAEVEYLARQLLDRARLVPAAQPPPNLSPRLECSKLSGGRVVSHGPVYGGFRSPAGRAGLGAIDGGIWPGSRPGGVHCGPGKRVGAQMEAYAWERGRSLARPLRPTRGWLARGAGRECGGTGVFLPRVFSDSGEVERKPYVKEAEQQKQQLTSNVGMAWKQGMPLQQPPYCLGSWNQYQ